MNTPTEEALNKDYIVHVQYIVLQGSEISPRIYRLDAAGEPVASFAAGSRWARPARNFSMRPL